MASADNGEGSSPEHEPPLGPPVSLHCQSHKHCFGVGHHVLGIDIGGTTIKAAPVDTRTGALLAEKHVLATPWPATPTSVAEVLQRMVNQFRWTGRVGVGIPSVVRDGKTLTAANIDDSWIGANAEALFSERLGLPVTVVNDADAAGYAEMGFGAGRGRRGKGVVILVTFGTGIGTAMFVDGLLFPNSELGHVELDGAEAEKCAAGVLVAKEHWSWDQWADRVNWFLSYVERLLWPNLFIVGGGVSNAHEEWLHKVKLPHSTPVLAAQMRNDAGIVGAALASLSRAAYSKNRRQIPVDECIDG